MRLSATILIVACCATSLMGCCGRHHRHGCWFSRHHRNECVDRADWEDDDYDDDDGHHQCGCDMCDGGYQMQGGMPMQSFDSGCGCGGGMSAPYFDGGMSMPMMSAPSSGCGCGSGGGMMSSPYPTYQNPVMMQPMAEPTPTPAQAPGVAPQAESYYSPSRGTPTAVVPTRF
jgi:hypothetical protein